MLELSEARRRALALVRPLTPTALPLLEAHGRYLAEPMSAPRDLPGCDNSAMDGFAVRAADTAGANRDRPAVLRLTETIYAGALPARTVGPGEAARLFTGARVPEGADAVVRQEAAALSGDRVEVFITAEAGANVRRRGEELSAGAPLFAAGQPLDAAALAVLAACGFSKVPARPSPRVAILSVGDELVPLGEPALPHQVHESNGVMIAALARQAGAQVVRLSRARDELDQLRARLLELSPGADLIITAGGASVGDKDLVKRALDSLEVDGVALKPGKPVAIGRFQGTLVLVLPGNPGAAATAFDQFGRLLLLVLQGVREERRRLEVRLDSDRKKQAGLTYLLAATVEPREGEQWARIPRQGAGQLLQNVGAAGWVVLPPGPAELRAGDRVTIELFSGATTRPL